MSRESQEEMAFAKQKQQQQRGASLPLAMAGTRPPPSPLPHQEAAASSSSSSSIPVSKLRTAELSLRITALVASVASFVFLLTDKQTKSFTLYTATIVQEARFNDVEAVVYSVVTAAVVAVYSLLQLVKVFLIDYASLAPESAIAWAFFLCDQAMAYVLLSASAALTQAAVFSKEGNDELGWLMVCDMYGRFCKQIGAGLVASIAAFIALVITSGISAFNLFAIGGAAE